MASTFSWGGKTWSYGDLAEFKKYLNAHGTSYVTWSANHAAAAELLTQPPDPVGTRPNDRGGALGPDPTPGTGPVLSDSPTDPGVINPTPEAPPETPGPASTDASSSGPTYPGESNPTPTSPIDNILEAPNWEQILGAYGLPPDVIAKLNQIWTSAGSDINAAVTLAQAYVRGTPWYATTYPGIQQGINAGLFSDEQGYRAYQNQVSQVYQQYYGRPPTTSEVSQYINRGESVGQVANQFQSAAILGNISDPLKALFSQDELKAFADQQAGIDTQLGQRIVSEANLAMQVNQLYSNFYGRTVTRSELDTLIQNGTDPQAVAQQFATQENINSMDPAIKDLFTPAEIQQAALDAAGGTTQNGQSLQKLMQLATQLNPLYHQYQNQGISRDELNAAYTGGLTPTQLAGQFQGKAYADANAPDIQQASGSFGEGLLSGEDLQSLGQEATGYDTPQGQKLLTAYQKALQRMNGAFKGSLATPAVSGLLRQPNQSDVAA